MNKPRQYSTEQLYSETNLQNPKQLYRYKMIKAICQYKHFLYPINHKYNNRHVKHNIRNTEVSPNHIPKVLKIFFKRLEYF